VELYQEYVFELKLTDRLNPLHEWDIRQPPPGPPPGPLTTQEIVAQLQQLAQAGVGLGAGISAAQLVELAVAMLPHVTVGSAQTTLKKVRVEKIKGAYLETVEIGNVFLTDLTYERDRVTTPQSGSQDLMKQELLWQRWEQEN
jgi:hypothetical protein